MYIEYFLLFLMVNRIIKNFLILKIKKNEKDKCEVY